MPWVFAGFLCNICIFAKQYFFVPKTFFLRIWRQLRPVAQTLQFVIDSLPPPMVCHALFITVFRRFNESTAYVRLLSREKGP